MAKEQINNIKSTYFAIQDDKGMYYAGMITEYHLPTFVNQVFRSHKFNNVNDAEQIVDSFLDDEGTFKIVKIETKTEFEQTVMRKINNSKRTEFR